MQCYYNFLDLLKAYLKHAHTSKMFFFFFGDKTENTTNLTVIKTLSRAETNQTKLIGASYKIKNSLLNRSHFQDGQAYTNTPFQPLGCLQHF